MENKKYCVFPGSFNPFHLGHLYLITKTIKNGFEKVFVLISNNENKIKSNKEEIANNIAYWLKNYKYKNNVVVLINNGLTTDYMEILNVKWIVRGYRNWNDFKYEKKLFKNYKKNNKNIYLKLFKSPKMLVDIKSSKCFNNF